MEVMKKFYSAVGVIFTTMAVVLLLANNVFASQTSSVINSTIKNKKFELPSKIHKDGEGFYEVGRMLTPRYYHSLALLPNDQILILGGEDAKGNLLKSTEIFDMKTKKSIAGPDLPFPMYDICTKTLSNGNVLIAGGKAYGKYDKNVHIYLPKERKIIKANGEISFSILHGGVIEEISKEEILVADGFLPIRYYAIYDTKYNTICNLVGEASRAMDSYIGRINNKLYFISYHGYSIDISNIPSKSNKIKSLGFYKLGLSLAPGRVARSFILKDGRTILTCVESGEIALFDTETNKVTRIIKIPKLSFIDNITLLNNGNILVFSAKSNDHDQVSEIDLSNFAVVNKNYFTPYIKGEIIQLSNGDLLYTGGAKLHSAGMVTFGYYYGVSDKIYLWKTKKENN